MEDKKSYGTVTVGVGSRLEKELSIVEYIQCEHKNHRLVSVAKLEDESYLITVENPSSTGRHPSSSVRLSLESYIGLISTSLLYWNKKGENMDELIKESIDTEAIAFSCSDNLMKDQQNEQK